jgi:hypothetical protein
MITKDARLLVSGCMFLFKEPCGSACSFLGETPSKARVAERGHALCAHESTNSRLQRTAVTRLFCIGSQILLSSDAKNPLIRGAFCCVPPRPPPPPPLPPPPRPQKRVYIQ